MTNEEALRLIKATEYCYVEWSTQENVVVAVHALQKGALSRMPNGCGGLTKGRFLDPAAVSIETLRNEQAETDRVSARQRIFWSWQASRTDDLVLLLETAAFPAPMDAFHGARHIIEQIYYARSPELSPGQIERLDCVAAAGPLDRAVTYRLECWLAVIHNDRKRLERFWRLGLARTVNLAVWSDFAIAAGDLPLDLHDVTDDFVATVARPGMFGPRFNAMLALGKIGASAGDRAASAILEHIYDSNEGLAALRDRVVSRIRTPASDWSPCKSCVKGMVAELGEDIPHFKACQLCLGLGHVRDGSSPTTDWSRRG